MRRKKIKELAESVLKYENIIKEGNQRTDNEVRSAKDQVIKIMNGLSLEEALMLDDMIMQLTSNK